MLILFFVGEARYYTYIYVIFCWGGLLYIRLFVFGGGDGIIHMFMLCLLEGGLLCTRLFVFWGVSVCVIFCWGGGR